MNRSRTLSLAVALLLCTPLCARFDDEEEPIAQPFCKLGGLPGPPRQQYGAWETVIPKPDGAAIHRILGMQTVHTVLLPSGKVLMISGSSWRNLDDGTIQYYPEYPDPATPEGIWKQGTDPFRLSKLSWYYELVNNAAIYDPADNSFYRIPHPVPVNDPDNKNHFAPNDFFCIGQQHLPDGNVLFTGGTQFYYPYRGGNNSTWIFDWKKELTIDWRKVDWRQVPIAGANNPLQNGIPESYYPPGATEAQYPWMFAGFMKRGRWYPSLLELLDGRMVVFSGFVGFDKGFETPANPTSMYTFQINNYVEFFDYSKFKPSDPSAAWKAIDVSRTPNSPFTVLINPTFKPTPGYEKVCPAQCMHDNQYDAFKLYPENYLMPDGRILLSREGDWVSLRTCDTAFMRKTKGTYFATVTGTADNPTMAFERGPDRVDEISSYGTSLFDPNSGKVEIIGGQPTSPGTLFPLNAPLIPGEAYSGPTHFAGGRGSRKLETFSPSKTEPGGGHWTLNPTFLGDNSRDDRTMHYAIVLPTKQVLVISGGNYDFYGPVFTPWMLTPTYDGKANFTGYDQKKMAEALEPRHYHNTAVLLPNGKIFISGGETARASVRAAAIPPPNPHQTEQPKPNLNLIDEDVYFFGDGPVAKGEKGMFTTNTEDWVGELFSPPYLFINGMNQSDITGMHPATPPIGYTPSKNIGGKTYYLIHSNQSYEVSLQNLPTPCTQNGSLVLIKLPSSTHGWENGQKFINLPFHAAGPGTIRFEAPDMKKANIPPAFYMMFYVDCLGKPATMAQMVRFDDEAKEP
jgi:hypothetical protein